VSARTGGEQPRAEPAVRNESEPHRMSPEMRQTAEPSRYANGEGCQDWAKANPEKIGRGLNDCMSSHHCGGVSEGGMPGRVLELRDEICSSGRQRPRSSTSGEPARLDWLRQKSERSIVATKARNGAGAKGPHLVEVNCETAGWRWFLHWKYKTPHQARSSQRTLCRSAKRTASTASAVNGLGKPDAVIPPVRFDEGRGVRRRTNNCGWFDLHC